MTVAALSSKGLVGPVLVDHCERCPMRPVASGFVGTAEIDGRSRSYSCRIPPDLVSLLLERGHGDEVACQASQGEWFCALAQARLLFADGRPDEAASLLGRYTATGAWAVAQAAAVLLEQAGMVEGALALVHRHAQVRGQDALALYAQILARHGRAEEAFDLLAPHVRDRVLAEAMVGVAEIAGRDAHAARLLEAEIAADGRGETRRPIDAWLPHFPHAPGLLAIVRERQGRVEDAIVLLRGHEDALADLLARHGRIEELRAYARDERHGSAAQRLAEVLEERGEIEQAIAVYRETRSSPAWRPNAAVLLAHLLARHGRGAEAIAGLSAFADSLTADNAIERIETALWDLYIQQQRATAGLARLDAFAARYDADNWDHLMPRMQLMAAAGQREEAIAKARAHPDAPAGHIAACIARLLAGEGRFEEAVGILERSKTADRRLWARYLIELDRPKEAISVLQRREPDSAQ